MVENLTVVVPFWNGQATIKPLLDSLPAGLPVVIVDDHSDRPLQMRREGVRVVWNRTKGFFTGAVNTGLEQTKADVLVLNQDIEFTSEAWLPRLLELRERYAVIGDGVLKHPAWPKGYVHGTFMFMRRDAIDAVGPMDAEEYPLWGSTCEWQLRACRKGYQAHVSQEWRKWFRHEGRGRQKTRRFGKAISDALQRWPDKKRLFIRTPPAVSVVIPCYNYGRYLEDAVNSLLGGETCLGLMEPQTLQSFEVIIVDDASTDDSWEVAQGLADSWKGVHAIRLAKNKGTPGALNAGVSTAKGEYVHILSADDMREPWGLEVLYRGCRDNGHSVTYGDIRIIKDGERTRLLKLPQYDFERVLHKNPMPAGIMYPRKAWAEVGGYPEEMTFGREDWAFNIGLGLKGYCGVHVGMSGNLYRRDGQNRSLRTGNRHKGEVATGFSWRKTFENQLRALYPAIYEGERPVPCCGGRNGSRKVPGSGRTGMVAAAGEQGMTLLEYVGGNVGNHVFAVQGRAYVFGNNDKRRRQYVLAGDAKELLELRHHTKPIFRAVKLAQPPVPKAEQVVANPEPEPDAEPESVVEVDATAAAVRVAGELGVELATVEGSGAGGRITVRDVRAAA